jgi:uncharacterized protein (TIGR02284 family)
MTEHIPLPEVESTLEELIHRLRDEQEAFRELGERLGDADAKRHFLTETQKRAEYAAELENELHRMGVHDVKIAPSVVTKAKLLLTELRAKIDRGDHPLLSAAEASEDEAKRAYTEALKHELPRPLREMLEKQYEHVQRSHDLVKAMRDKSR